MTEKLDLEVDVSHLAAVEPEVLATLRVGQHLILSRNAEKELIICTEAGVQLAPLSITQLAARFLNPKVIVRAIKRDTGSNAIQKFQIRIYRGSDAGASGADGVNIRFSTSCTDAASSGTPAAAAACDTKVAGSAAEDEQDYKLRRAQYQALAESEELRAVLADPHLQTVLRSIDSAPDRERALAAQLEAPGFQGFVSQVLMRLDPERVPATAATAAAVAMATG